MIFNDVVSGSTPLLAHFDSRLALYHRIFCITPITLGFTLLHILVPFIIYSSKQHSWNPLRYNFKHQKIVSGSQDLNPGQLGKMC